MRTAFEAAAALLEKHGVVVDEVKLPSAFDRAAEYNRTIAFAELAMGMLNEERDGMDELLVSWVDQGAATPTAEYLAAIDGAAALRGQWDAIAGAYDAVLAPSTVDEAPVGRGTGSPMMCTIWTVRSVLPLRVPETPSEPHAQVLHCPVVNVPGFGGPNGLPIGMSLIAPRFRDRHLLDVAEVVGEVFEAEGGWKSAL
jgi:amidase